MKKRKNTMAKVTAAIALLSIVIGIIGTGVLVIVSSLGNNESPELSQEELQEYLDSLSGSISASESEL